MSNASRRALVTGGSSGIGRCVAETLARDGCDVGIFYLGEPEDAAEVVQQIESVGRRAWVRIGDVSDSRQVTDAVESFVQEMSGVQILVNNAGIVRDQVIWKMTDEQWQQVIDVDLTGVFNFSRAVASHMRNNGEGAIVNISSINGLRGKFGQTNYAAAKAGVIGLTKSLAKEMARFGVTVNAVAPGLIDTPFLDAMPEQKRQAATAEILMGRIGTAQDVADAVAFLCSDHARFITGVVLKVDGGQYI
jgi:3-oxoacyl-[acyl-carrier protein] reductase